MYNLTLTSVVFESGTLMLERLQSADLTLTSVVFESYLYKMHHNPFL